LLDRTTSIGSIRYFSGFGKAAAIVSDSD